MARTKQQILLKFPMEGVNVVGMRNEQKEGTCYDALNVRPFDQLESRARGGSRPGLIKYSTARQSANRVQDLNYVTTISNSLAVGSMSRRTIIPVMVTNGVIGKFDSTSVTNASVAGTQVLGNATQSPFAHSAELFQRLYYADGFGYKVYVGSNNATIDWTPTAGSLPGDIANSVTCRLVEQWRGRIVLSGLATDAHNWFMSKLGDPLDWDYVPATETELDAVQGGAGFVGKVPDIINALVPYNDDVLLFGCDHSIWMMSGDPQAGGRLDLVTNTVGMAFGRPYTQLPDGTLIFFSNRGSVYQMAPGSGKPISITQDSIDPLITNTNLNTNIVKMAYDEQVEGVHLFITPLTSGNTTHWFYDIRNKGWFKVQYASNSYNPVSVMVFDGDSPSDRVVLFGGEDGYVRKYNTSAYQDDGTSYTSYVIMGPIVSEKGRQPTVLTDVQFIMDDTSGNTIYELGVGDTAESALADFASTFTAEKYIDNTAVSIAAGKSINHNPRTRGYFQYFKIGAVSTAAPWAIEYIQASYSIVNSSKGRVSISETINYFRPDEPAGLVSTNLVVAYWGTSRTQTQSGGFLTAWTKYQNGSTTYPAIAPVGSVVVTNSDALMSSKPTVSSANSAFNYLTDNACPIGCMDFGQGFITMACYFSNNAVTNATLFQFKRTASTELWKVMGTMAANAMTFRIRDEFGAGNTSSAANATIAHNTPVIISFGSATPAGPWQLWINNTFVLSHNLSQFWDNVDDGVNTLTFRIGGSGNMGWTLGAFAVYSTDTNSVMYGVQNTMASYYGITLN